jgi:hypothetical protein
MVISGFLSGRIQKQKAGREKRPAGKKYAYLRMVNAGTRKQYRSTKGPHPEKGKGCTAIGKHLPELGPLYPDCKKR